MRPLGCVTGRFQPVHAQHAALFGLALARCEHLVVAVTNPHADARHAEPTSDHRHTAGANPFTYYERARLLDVALRAAGLADRATLVPFDLTRPGSWADYVPRDALQVVRAYSAWEREKAHRLAAAGYEVLLLDGDPAGRLSASDIRAGLRAGDWRGLALPATHRLLEAFLHDRPMAARA